MEATSKLHPEPCIALAKKNLNARLQKSTFHFKNFLPACADTADRPSCPGHNMQVMKELLEGMRIPHP